MSHIILVTGGSRSGKSAHALEIARRLDGPRLFIATCPALDDEMRLRIQELRVLPVRWVLRRHRF